MLNFSAFKFGIAPMAGYTDMAFRLLCREHGADFGVTELVSSESIIRGNEQGFRLAAVCKEERPVGIQIFGCNPKSMAHAAQLLEKEADFIDLNFGCPAPKVTRNMGGAALLEKPDTMSAIIREVSSTIKKPTTAKMRLGVSSSHKAVEIAKLIEKSGASALAVHARTLNDGYSGQPDWHKIKEIKSALSIPVFGNGNVSSYSDAKMMFETTKCDAVLIGRACLGNPFIFNACKKQDDSVVSGLSFVARKNAFFRYMKLREKLRMRENLGDLKGQAISFVHGIQGAAELRLRISTAKDKEDVLSAFTCN